METNGSSLEQEMKERQHGCKMLQAAFVVTSPILVRVFSGRYHNNGKRLQKVLKRNPQQMKQRKADAVSSKAIFPYSGQPPPGWKLGNGMAF